MEQGYDIEGLVHAKHIGNEWSHERAVLRMLLVVVSFGEALVESFGEALNKGSSDISEARRSNRSITAYSPLPLLQTV